jgi:ubiquinone/menaquinone biosynthesis C-methylase UbiE
MLHSTSDLYTREYFLGVCGGWAEFRSSGGTTLPPRHEAAARLCPVWPGARVLDVGTGRGELPLHLATAGAEVWAVDSSRSALSIADGVRRSASPDTRRRIHLLHCDARSLPVADDCFDGVYMLDLVEHLEPGALHAALLEARRVLRPGRPLVIHTMPNLWYYHVGYPVYRRLMQLGGRNLPRDPRERVPLMREMHVNEQSPTTLRQTLREAGLFCRLRLRTSHSHEQEPRLIIRALMNLCTRLPPLRAVLCNEIFAVAWSR